MLSFRDKTVSKKNISNAHVNIDNKHQEFIKKCNDNKIRKIELNKEIQQINIKLKKLELIPNNHISDEQLEQKFELKERINQIEHTISSMNTIEDPNLYYLNTGHILFQYYNMCNESVSNLNIEKNQNISENDPLSKSILNFFKKNDTIKQDTVNPNIVSQNIEILPTQKSKKILTKSEMMDKYMNYVDTRFISDKNKEEDIEICRKCNAQKYFINAEGLIVCQKCGAQEYVLIDCDKPSYKEPPKEIAYFAYKRINHFKNWSGTVGVYCLMVWTIINAWKTIIHLFMTNLA